MENKNICYMENGGNMKKITYKKILVIILFSIIFIILNFNSSKAVLQANGNDGTAYNLSDWMKNVRRMEELGGAMGLSESLNDNLTSSSTSNNIDVHMEKNTEYGALAILSASSYGNPNKVENGNTTTGNVTGVVMKINSELVAAGSDNTAFKYAVGRYKNIYKGEYISKSGDAIKETIYWHGGDAVWNSFQYAYVAFRRSYSGSIFSYNIRDDGDPGYWQRCASRAVVVSGEGF